MSRIGKQPIEVPTGVTVDVKKTSVTVTGPKGEVSTSVHPAIRVLTVEDGKQLVIERPSNSKQHRSLHGLVRSLLAAAVAGVGEPYRKTLNIVGVGYTAKLVGGKLVLQIGFCHPVEFSIPDDLQVDAPTNQVIHITGCNKQQVGQFAANIRRVRPPEPYNGKGIRYEGERVVRKAGKSFVSGEK